MLKKLIAGILATIMLANTAIAGFDMERFDDAEDRVTSQVTQEFINKVTVNGMVNPHLVRQELVLENGEEETWVWIVVGIVAASIKASCENDWSYRDKDRCVGKCDGYNDKKDNRRK